MKRDMNLIRDLLLAVEGYTDEEGTPGEEVVASLTKDGAYTEFQVNYHADLLREAGLILASEMSSAGSDTSVFIFDRLTWEGYEFLDNARDDTRWNQVKRLAEQKTGALSFEVVKSLLVQLAKSAAGLG